MSAKFRNENDLEKQYYTQIYKKNDRKYSKSSTLIMKNDDVYYLLGSRKNAGSTSLKSNRSSSSFLQLKALYANMYLNGGGEQFSMKYIDESETESIVSSMRRLGYESASVSSILNLRNQSYLNGRENDCVDRLIMQLGEEKKGDANEEEKKLLESSDKEDQVALVDKHKRRNRLLRSVCNKQFYSKRFEFVLDLLRSLSLFKAIDFQSRFYLLWLAVVSSAYIYNLIGISLRYSFEYDHVESTPGNDTFDVKNQTLWLIESDKNLTEKWSETDHTLPMLKKKRTRFLMWLIADYVCDLVYLIDIFLVQTRIKFIRDGLWVIDLKSTAKNYIKSYKFYVI